MKPKPTVGKTFFLGQVMGTRKRHGLNFDPAFQRNEDIDFLTQAVHRYGRVVRFNHIACETAREQPGGCRLMEGSTEEARAQLLAKWPRLLKPDDRRDVGVRWR